MSTTALFKELMKVWDEKFPYVKEILEPAPKAKELKSFAKEVQRELPQEFIELYSCTGGASSSFFDHTMLIPTLERIKETIDMQDEYDGDGWSKDWLPVFLDVDNDEGLAIDTTGKTTGKKGQLVQWWYDLDEKFIAYASLDNLLKTLIEKSKAGVYLYEESGVEEFGTPNGCNIYVPEKWDSTKKFYDVSPAGKNIDAELNPGYPKVLDLA